MAPTTQNACRHPDAASDTVPLTLTLALLVKRRACGNRVVGGGLCPVHLFQIQLEYENQHAKNDFFPRQRQLQPRQLPFNAVVMKLHPSP